MKKKSNDNIEGNEEPNLISKWKPKVILHLISFATKLGILSFLVGICAQIFFDQRLYVFIFGLICLLQILNGVLFYIFNKKDNSTVNLIISLINLVWIVAAIVLLVVYRLWVSNDYFENDIVFQLNLLFYVIVAIALAICYYPIIKSIGQPTDELKTKSEEKVKPKDSKEKDKKKGIDKKDSNEDSKDKKKKQKKAKSND